MSSKENYKQYICDKITKRCIFICIHISIQNEKTHIINLISNSSRFDMPSCYLFDWIIDLNQEIKIYDIPIKLTYIIDDLNNDNEDENSFVQIKDNDFSPLCKICKYRRISLLCQNLE